MKIRIFAGIALLAFIAPAFGQVNTIPAARHLVIKGHAQQDVLPDRFTIRMTIQSVDMKPDSARNRVQAHVAEILQSMKATRVLEDQVTATAISVKPKTEYENREEIFLGTEVSRNIRATFGKAEDLQAFLARTETSLEVQIDGIETFYSKHEKVESDLRVKAIASTKQKAEELASAYGARVTGLYAVSEVQPDFDYGNSAFKDFTRGTGHLDRIEVTGSRISPEDLEVGTVTLESDLYAVFLISE
ncbi:MAG: SIMPL domain-containing protein [Thermomonas sp.]